MTEELVTPEHENIFSPRYYAAKRMEWGFMVE